MKNEAEPTKRGLEWKLEMLNWMSDPRAPRALSAGQLHAAATAFKADVTIPTARALSEHFVSIRALRRVGSGFFLNNRAHPTPTIQEAAQHIRAGAVVSLQTVLGEAGSSNNPSEAVTAVLPVSSTKRPSLGRVDVSTGEVFHFYGLAERFFEAPPGKNGRAMVYESHAHCPTFTPTAALLQWVHLASMKRSSLTRPPHGDIEFSDHVADDPAKGLNLAHAKVLSAHWGIEDQFSAWMTDWERVRRGRDDFEAQANVSAPLARRARP